MACVHEVPQIVFSKLIGMFVFVPKYLIGSVDEVWNVSGPTKDANQFSYHL